LPTVGERDFHGFLDRFAPMRAKLCI
jgi:hypothetical protein